jgi:CRISPR-associated protein (Cas_APE2256)
MTKVMVVTVGTSLFHSASWEPKEVELPQYAEWTARGERSPLTKPEQRKRTSHSEKIQSWLTNTLRTNNTEDWAKRLAGDLLSPSPDAGTFMRYSAELATILRLFEVSREFAAFPEFLSSYARIYFVCDSDSPAPYVAAHHLSHYLNQIAGTDALSQAFPVPGLSSDEPDVLVGETTGLGCLSQFLLFALAQTDQMDIVISGGFKLYGIGLYPLTELDHRAVRLLYIHEEGKALIQIPKKMQAPSKDPLIAQQVENARQRRLKIGVFS